MQLILGIPIYKISTEKSRRSTIINYVTTINNMVNKEAILQILYKDKRGRQEITVVNK